MILIYCPVFRGFQGQVGYRDLGVSGFPQGPEGFRFLLENGKVFTGKNYETKKFDKLGNDIGAEKDYCIYSIARIGML